ncbi:hypothetical protein M422DRAFT_782779 [Sphaerobolus stellatus SS14]|uniref:Prokaryotic-type class I peptide chain release factors domain-containing protein n=1 Tax=Sphaerobolus stellatus (strain SS14) TaxID=990650 RepID=A0A0C9TW73_SPHS4|nr:hypothetical protein M422DRAFT_782779 [Sphaerobolus stellatus SS14]
MSISPSLQASARAAYRSLFRAAKTTFGGDEPVLNAFLDKARTEYRNGRSINDEKAYQEKVKLAEELAVLLRRNIVRAEKRPEQDLWKLNITKETELGDNAAVKEPAKIDPSMRRPCREVAAEIKAEEEKYSSTDNSRSSCEDSDVKAVTATPQRRINLSELKRLRKQREIPTIDENDLEESFVRGSGPGGQSINKTENCVQLLHKPTKIRVSCQETRSLEQNRKIARKLLLQKLDKINNPGMSKPEFQQARQRERERQKQKKRRKKEKEHQRLEGAD